MSVSLGHPVQYNDTIKSSRTKMEQGCGFKIYLSTQ